MLIAFHKPFGIVSRFTADGSDRPTLAGYGFPPSVYPLGRLDAESEGLLLLTDEKGLNEQLLHPLRGHRRIYWSQVERVPSQRDLEQVMKGVVIRGHKTLPCRCWILDPQPELPPRDPPVRFRKTVPTCWLGLELVEGKNRQVRHMTAAINHPTLRLIRMQIGEFALGDLPAGRWILLEPEARQRVFASPRRRV